MEKTFILLIFGLILATSCHNTKSLPSNKISTADICNDNLVYSYSTEKLPNPLAATEIDTILLNHFSKKSLFIANTFNLIEPLKKYVSLSLKPSLEFEEKWQYLVLKSNLQQALFSANVEISAVCSRIDCEEERVEQLADYLKKQEDRFSKNITVAAIVTGGLGAILIATLIDRGNAADIVGAGVGITEATLGTLLFLNEKKIEYYNKINPLREIWYGDTTSSFFPPEVWYYLTNSDLSSEGNNESVRNKLINRWKEFDQVNRKRNSVEMELLLSETGGLYTVQLLKTKAAMLDQLEAQVALMKNDISTLSREIAYLKAF
ncbi:MAG: hypothetical protein ACXITV_13360 [Luteibaculaceae bacterium]